MFAITSSLFLVVHRNTQFAKIFIFDTTVVQSRYPKFSMKNCGWRVLTINLFVMDGEEEDKVIDPDLMDDDSPDLGDAEEVDLL